MVYRSRVRVERVRGPIRRAYQLAEPESVPVGVHAELAAHYGVAPQVHEPRAAPHRSSNRWLFEQPHEYVPLVVLALVPAGRVWGLDARITRTRPALRRWPF